MALEFCQLFQKIEEEVNTWIAYQDQSESLFSSLHNVASRMAHFHDTTDRGPPHSVT